MQEKEIKAVGNQENRKTFSLLLSKDWSYIPIRFDKRPDARLLDGGKWGKYQNVLPSMIEGATWTDLAHGLGIVTGSLSGVIVLDVDTKKGDGMESLKGRHLPPTPIVRTPSGGWHYYFKHPGSGKKIKTAKDILPNVDIRGDGGYAVMPGAPGYEWVIHPDVSAMADAPEWLVELTVAKPKTKKIKAEKKPETKPDSAPRKPAKVAKISTEKIKKALNQEATARAFMDAVGLHDKEIDQGFNCILPGHHDNNPSASIHRGNNGAFVYMDFHGKSGENAYLLAEVWASLHYKQVIKYRTRNGSKGAEGGNGELMIWAIRMLVDLGLLAPYEIEYKPLPDGVPASIRKVYDGFIYLLQCRWIYDPGKPAPFTRRFACGWCGTGERQTGQAIKYLIDNKFIKAQSEITIGGRKTRLFNLID